MERVQALRQAVVDGNYRHTPEEIAVAVLSHMITESAG